MSKGKIGNMYFKKASGGWLDELPQQYPDGGKLTEAIYKFAEGGSLSDDPTKPYHAVTNPDGYKGTNPPLTFDKNDPYGKMRYQAYNDSLNVYNGVVGDIDKLKNAKTFDEWWKYTDNKTEAFNRGYRSYNNLAKLNKKTPKPIRELNRYFGGDSWSGIGTAREYKKPTTPIELIDRQPYSPIQTNPNSTVQLPINSIPLQQIPTIGVGEPGFEGNNAYWKKQGNKIIRQNNEYSAPMSFEIASEPGDRFHQEPSWYVGEDKYYERDGKAYLVPQPKGGWSKKQALDASSGKWKSKIIKKANGGWLNNL